MSTFQLKSGADTLDFDLAGNVTKAGAAFGAWTVTSDNKIQLKTTAGATSALGVDWGFNGSNQLELRQRGNVIYNFHTNSAVIPQIQTSNGTLVLAPDLTKPSFLIILRGVWGMDANFNMTLSISGDTTVASSIDGILDPSSTSQFIFSFQTPAPTTRAFKLVFKGAWNQRTTGNLDVDFVYTAEAGKTATIHLPAGLQMEPTKAMLVYTYDKGTKTTSITLAGNVQINHDFSLTYGVDAQGAGGIKSTTFHIGGTFNPDSPKVGKFLLTVQRNGVDHTLEIDGQFAGTLGGNKLTVGFSYVRHVGGTSFQDTIAFNGSVSNPAGNKQFNWSVSINGKQVDIDISAQIALASGTCIRTQLNFMVSGQQMAISAMFGVSTNCTTGHSLSGSQTLPQP